MTRVIISYDGLLGDWRACAGKLLKGLTIPLPIPTPETVAKIEAFLSSSQRHHTSTSKDVRLDPGMKTWIADVYEAMRTLEDEPKAGAALQILDRAGDQLDAAAPTIRQLVSETRGLHRRKTDALKATHAETHLLRGQLVAQELEIARLKQPLRRFVRRLRTLTWQKVARRLENPSGLVG